MKTTSLRANALACALLAGTAFCGLAAGPAAAQAPSPTFRNLDGNGVDLVRGDFLTGFPEGSIGSGEAELALLRMVGATGGGPWFSGSQWDNILLDVGTAATSVSFGPRSDTFPGAESRGATLLGSGDSRLYRSPDGTIIDFTDPNAGDSQITNFCDTSGTQAGCMLVPTSIRSPGGKTVSLEWEFWPRCVERQNFEDPTNCHYTPRLSRVSNSFGYSIQFTYESEAPEFPTTANPPSSFSRRTGASFRNGGTELASVGYQTSIVGSSSIVSITDTGGRVWQVTSSPSNYIIRRPGATSDTVNAALTGEVVTSVTKAGVVTNYSRTVSGGVVEMRSSQTIGGQAQLTTTFSNLATGRPSSVTDPLNHTTEYSYDPSGRLTRVTAPEDNYVQYVHDERGNVKEMHVVAKPGSGLPTISTFASYDPACGNPVTCNQPNTTTDERGNVTEYAYDPNHGGVLAVTGPALASGLRSQTRYGYTDVSGEIRLTSVRACQTQQASLGGNPAACAGGPDEAVTELQYDDRGNVLQVTRTDGPHTPSLTAVTALAYDGLGNLTAVDGPLPGADDKMHFHYNGARQPVGTISPDPDGGGALKRRAVRNVYTDGLLTRTEQGNVEGTDLSHLTAMIPAQAVETERDGHGRPNRVKLISGNAVYALTQTSYDALGRPDCVAQRMTPAAFGSLPADACSPGAQGGDGPDRIARTIYDAAGRAVQVKTAFAIPSQVADEVTTTYTDNGLTKTVTDAEGNRTTYEYDDHDRLVATRYPVAAKGADASAPASGTGADFEQLTYESLPGGRTSNLVASFRNRGGDLIGFGYDALGRLISKNRPGTEPDVTYGYDLLGRMTSASQPGHSLAFTYDALGRLRTESGPLGTFTSEWDLAGRRTRLTWPDTFFVTYDYLVTGEMTRIRENGAASGIGVLATFGYDPLTAAGQLGLRTSLARGNGTVTSYAYDPVSRLQQLRQDVEGAATANDLTLNFGYNPASQISLVQRSNDLYAWTGHGSETTGTTSNGRNQLANWVNALGYDSEGNITGNGTYTFGYSSENLLTSLTNPVGTVQTSSTYAYDPLMRLAKIDSSNSALDADLAYDGQEIVLEGLSNNRTRRYVFGPDVDEPLVAYLVTSTGTSRSWYHADERGSTIRQTNDAGNPAGGIGRYDEYGVGPGTSRFQYTGQYWLGDNGLHYYRARVYDPKLGRFLQPDPIGYQGGMNLYAYVKGDPVNFTDPLGLQGDGPDVVVCGGWTDPVTGKCVKHPSMVGGGVYFGSGDGSPAVLIGGESSGGIPAIDCGEMCAEIPHPGPRRGSQSENLCVGQSGPVLFGSFAGEGYLGMGGGLGGGAFWDAATDEIGLFGSGESTFVPSSGSLGWGGSLSGQLGVATNLSSFAGEYSVIGAGFGPVGFNYSFATDDIFSPISLSIGPSANLMPWPPLPASFHYSQGGTKLLRNAIRRGRCG